MVKLPLSSHLKKQLIDDWKHVTENNKVSPTLSQAACSVPDPCTALRSKTKASPRHGLRLRKIVLSLSLCSRQLIRVPLFRRSGSERCSGGLRVSSISRILLG